MPISIVAGRLPGEVKEGVDSNGAAVVQSALSHSPAVCEGEVTRARAHRERTAAGLARAESQPAETTRWTVGAGPRSLVGTLQKLLHEQSSNFKIG
ncbi:unnamed protein product [Leptidea sinapis]|uniref:Uncharacterized protein n=1 Tax=Leptidea sinapis TaxID=189913 RepID=A0A5E4QIQ7_9NEOP|nr:unnamed protein product [Leptidea sinapis]